MSRALLSTFALVAVLVGAGCQSAVEPRHPDAVVLTDEFLRVMGEDSAKLAIFGTKRKESGAGKMQTTDTEMIACANLKRLDPVLSSFAINQDNFNKAVLMCGLK